MGKWISVKDKLPEVKYEWYLVCDCSGNPNVTMAFYDGTEGDNGYVWLCHNDVNDRDDWPNVTH